MQSSAYASRTIPPSNEGSFIKAANKKSNNCFRMPSATPPAENGAPRSELEQLQLRSGQVTDEVNIDKKLLADLSGLPL